MERAPLGPSPSFPRSVDGTGFARGVHGAKISRWRFEFHRKQRILFLLLAAFAFLLLTFSREGWTNERTRVARWSFPSLLVCFRSFVCVYVYIHTITRSFIVNFWIWRPASGNVLSDISTSPRYIRYSSNLFPLDRALEFGFIPDGYLE